MCGFFQVVQKRQPIDKNRFADALRTMNHRGPDGEGMQFETLSVEGEKIYAGFGHKRLSILDLDHRSDQPFHADGNILLYNGEVYNYREIKEAYVRSGASFLTDGDTEVVHKVLSGKEDVSGFNGMWALSLYRKQQHTIFLSRDRYGKKPLFYYLDEKTFCVSSTVKAIKTYLGMHLSFDRQMLSDYILYGNMYPSEKIGTHIENINQLLPGYNGHFDCKRWKITQEKHFDWFHHEKKEEGTGSLKEALTRSVSLRLVSDRPVGLLLSGGIDSSLILSVLHACGLHENVKVFMGDTGRSDDYAYAKRCADQLGIKAETIVSDYDSNAFGRFLEVCRHHEKPFPFNGNAIAMPQMYEEVSKEGIPVVLDGTGGDEIFGGYWGRHMPYAMRDAQRDGNESWINGLVAHNGSKNDVVRSLDSSYLANKRKALKKKHLYDQLNPFIKIESSQIWNSQDPDPLDMCECGFNEALCTDVAPGGRLADWIWHNDRNSMMYSVESRSPFLDVGLHPFIFTGYDKKYHESWNKYELRKIFDSFSKLPTQWRAEKQGFRWDGKHFFKNNKEDILALLSQSEVLKEYMRIDTFVSVSNKFPNLLKSSLGRRALSIAGVEYGFKQ